MRQVDIWIENDVAGVYDKIELFQDEEIIINSSIQNVQDISKVFTDFSQTFTIPASAENNRIFKHYYENAIDTSINPNYRRNAYIEIDLSPFKSGKIAIEKANIVNDKVESYTITFYGLVISLKDKFEKFKLVDLDYSSINVSNDVGTVSSYIDTFTDNDIAFPLISTQKDENWNYGLGGTNDISTTGGAINVNYLNPALRVKKILEFIEDKCGVTFTGAFLNDKRFTKAFLYYQNSLTKEKRTQAISFDSLTVNNYSDPYDGESTTAYNELLNNNKVTTYWINQGVLTTIKGKLVSSSLNEKVFIDLYANGTFERTIEGITNTDIIILNEQAYKSKQSVYTFKFRTENSLTGKMQIQVVKPYVSQFNGNLLFGGVKYIKLGAESTTYIWSNKYDLSDYAPDMSIEDFVTSIIKTFNLTVLPKSEIEFEFIPLDDFYSVGKVYDITPYVDIDDITISRIPLSKKTIFKHEKTNNLLNEQYYNNTKGIREYGDYLNIDNNLEEGEFTIESKFGDILTEKIATNMYIGYALDKALQPSIQAPLLLYVDDTLFKTLFLTDGSINVPTLTYRPFIQETTINGTRYSIHFSNELSVKDNITLYNNLFTEYYASYFFGLTNPKNRLTNVTTTFPLSLLTKIKLYDRLVIRDKRYIINDIKQNLTTSEVELNLLHDFRQLINATIPNALQSGGQMSFIMSAPDGGTAQMDYDISLDTEAGVGYETENDLLLLTEYSQTVSGGSQLVTISYPPIQETTYLIDSSGNELITDNGLNIVSNEVTGNYFTLTFTLFYEDGSEYTQPYNVFYE
jgi:hypothetical protein